MIRAKRSVAGQVHVPLLVKLGLFAAALLAIWWLAFSSPATSPQVAEPAIVDSAQSTGPAAAGSAPPPSRTPELGTSEPATGSSERAQAEPAPQDKPPSPQPSAAPAPPAPRASTVTATAPQRQGPVDELAQRFASESRGDASAREETRVKEAFTDPQIPSTLVQSAECRRSVCRLQLRWSPEHDASYVLGLTRAVGSFSAPLGIEEPGPPDANGQRPLVVYFGLSR